MVEIKQWLNHSSHLGEHKATEDELRVFMAEEEQLIAN
jgi:hypothetical protein